ncbi:hypothetical protein Glove_141g42 [Diversispora epigaea]|uniref:RNase H type-1 domain-containing protein n=1 Tax=Diversispora epigaea TaxID=1348612 RepID=A0A397J165_9GLOM|nr:hypothetical protein Glove_141g42 [Diversispora epigaea]
MLVPCEGCEENIGNKIDDCVVRLDNKNETEIEIPVAYSKVSTSKTSIGKYKLRIRMLIKNIKKALEIIESSQKESGCEENIGNKIDDCVVRLDNKNETEIEIPVAYSKVSTSKTSIGKYKLRIRMLIKNIKKALEIIESSQKEKLSVQKLETIRYKLRNKTEVEVYTDEKFPSSTRAELMAILTALTIMLERSVVNIYTDSMCAIHSISKAHEGNHFNEMTDQQAQVTEKTIEEDHLIKINYKNIKNRSFISTWEEIPLELSVKQTLKKINMIRNRQRWNLQKRFQRILDDKTWKIDWITTFKTLHPSKITNDYTSKEDHTKRSFAMKLFNGELPVILQRFKHQPHIYNSPKCVLCGRYEETDIHVFDCKRNNHADRTHTPMTEHYRQLIDCLTSKIQKQTKELDKDKIQRELKSLSELCPKCVLCGRYEETDIHVFDCKRNNHADRTHTPMTEHYRQLIDCLTSKIQKQTKELDKDKIQRELKSLITEVTSILKSREKARETIIEGMVSFKEYLKDYWKERCEKVAAWETENNITNKSKRQKKRKKY